MKKDKYYILFCLIALFNATAQIKSDSLTFHLNLNFEKRKIELDKTYISKNNDTLSFETIKFYVSNFKILYTDKTSYKEPESYHLIDVENKFSLTFSMLNETQKTIQSIQFNIGVDSLASVSGAMKGDLDATKGMYWAWQSGFINMKIEGKSNSCKTRKNKFQFHVGGYLEPNYAIRIVKIPVEKSQITNDKINLVLDLGKFFSEINLKETNTIMIPGKEAMKIADLTSKLFAIE